MDKRHGGPWDRGKADSFYQRGMSPHYYVRDTYTSRLVTEKDMTKAEVTSYRAGYLYNQARGTFKEY